MEVDTTTQPIFEADSRFNEPEDPINDPYQDPATLLDPSVCDDCGAVYDGGHWKWMQPPAHAMHIRCPACSRIRDDLPAGYISIEGQYAHDHREELLTLVRNQEAHDKAAHPLQRIMSIETHPTKLRVTTTDIHLARNIGEALFEDYQGHLDFNYTDADYLLRVNWWH